jgi:hypothetical protein
MWHVWGTGELHTGFWWGDLSERGHLEDFDIDGKIILKCIFRNLLEGVDWIDLAQDSDT